ncbi:hypothetical protein RA307_12340 [Xanthobacteraceae bacterium Astr-EGSB]|uniref:hypothetical protein n=1 Tax=Astrobacterium formosum TaxID=3069710 RepID=UPI0027AF73C1|nr:hypothetical protein [Xanthobacteraceae bacterium Astr-EGSB]
MTINTRIYAGGAISFGGQPAIDDLIAAGYSAVIVWSVHVASDGTLALNNTQIVANGVYQEAQPMDLPSRLAQLRKAGVQVIFSVGSGGVSDYQHIGALLAKGSGPGTPLYDNFAALKAAMVAGGGDIDAIDFDNEDDMQTSIMVGFGEMLAAIGYASVTFCPYFLDQVWTDTYTQLLQQCGSGFVSAIHLQCYSGGAGQSPDPWGDVIAKAGGNTLLIPGLATNQAGAGPWWDNGAPGTSVVKTPNVAMYGQADWSTMLRQGNYPSADAAMQATLGGETFFFYCRNYLDLGPGKQFQTGDAVYFAGIPWWGSAPQCDAYALSGGCRNIYNDGGACPSDLQSQYAAWKKGKHPPDGGFIWLYDSVVNCLLSGCCGGSETAPTTTAKDYRLAITNGLS